MIFIYLFKAFVMKLYSEKLDCCVRIKKKIIYMSMTSTSCMNFSDLKLALVRAIFLFNPLYHDRTGQGHRMKHKHVQYTNDVTID
jgi:hypothetical protein